MTNESGPSFHRFRYWLPGLLLAAAGGLVLMLLAMWLGSFGYVAVLGIPFVIGCAVGYGVYAEKAILIMLGLGVVFALIGGLITLDLAGLLCGAVVAGIVIGPLVVGSLMGVLLRNALKNTRFSQRRYLPVLLLFAATGGGALLEHALTEPGPPETIATVAVLPMTAGEAWDSLVFYEQVRHEPPLLARIGLPYPLRTEGGPLALGASKRCVYDSGHLVKRITEYRPGERLGFDVVEQRGIEDRSVRLLHGSFRFEPAEGGSTRVTLSTSYAPLLSARLVWRPFERRIARTLHEHVLLGMRLEARHRRLQVRHTP